MSALFLASCLAQILSISRTRFIVSIVMVGIFSVPLLLTSHLGQNYLLIPPDVYNSTLTTYQSQLVLVGGVINGVMSNKVWASADGHNWHQSLPPMSRCRRWPTKAVSSASPECLIVVSEEFGYASMEVLSSGK